MRTAVSWHLHTPVCFGVRRMVNELLAFIFIWSKMSDDLLKYLAQYYGCLGCKDITSVGKRCAEKFNIVAIKNQPLINVHIEEEYFNIMGHLCTAHMLP